MSTAIESTTSSSGPSAFEDEAADRSAFRPLFTVFTATYNRAHTLPRVFECLQSQTCRDFEWLIVDDGSVDGTRELVDHWRGRTDIRIRYMHQPHAGKHVAFNAAVRAAAGQLFLPWDSDDGAVPQALERFKAHWESIPEDRRGRFSAVTALCVDEEGHPIGDRFPDPVTDSNSLEQYFAQRIRGEKWGFQRTDVLLDHPFPEPPGVTFVPEAIVWFSISRRFATRYVNDYLRIYYSRDRSDSRLSHLSVPTARGRLLFHRVVIQDYLDYARVSPLLILKSAVNYSRYSFAVGAGPIGQIAGVSGLGRRCLVLAAIPAGYAFSIRDRLGSRSA